MIRKGYVLKARCIQESLIAHAPPHAREIFDYLVREANYEDRKVDGTIIKRGQVFTSYSEIQEALHWKIGYRKETYSKWACEAAMKLLTKATMVTTAKTTRGMIITVLNYDKFQDFENYENHNEHHNDATREPQPPDTIQNTLNTSNTVNAYIYIANKKFKKAYMGYQEMRKKKRLKMTPYAEELILKKLHSYPLEDAIKMLEQSIENSWTGLFPVNAQKTTTQIPNITAGRTITGLKIIRSGSSWVRKDTSEIVDEELVKQGVLNESEWITRKNMLWKQKTAACGKCRDGWLTTSTGEKPCECIKEIYLI